MLNIDFNKLIKWMLPFLRRQTIYFSWMQTLCAGVVSMYNELMVKRTADLYQINHDSRVFSMQAVFNDQFDNVNRRIYITDGFNKERIYLFTREENKPLYLYQRSENKPVYLFNRTDYADTGVDFIVWVPNAIVLSAQNLTLLTSLVSKYKLASKRFAIYRV